MAGTGRRGPAATGDKRTNHVDFGYIEGHRQMVKVADHGAGVVAQFLAECREATGDPTLSEPEMLRAVLRHGLADDNLRRVVTAWLIQVRQ